MRNLSVSLFALAALAGSANAGVVFSEDFENGHIGQFTYEDYQDGGSSFEWDGNAETQHGNYTGGSGSAAMSNSGAAPGEYDHAIVSPEIDLSKSTNNVLNYLSNYQNFANEDFADTDISVDGGQSWKNLLSWNVDHGAFESTPGESVSIDLSAFDGQSIKIRFHHYNPLDGDDDWYLQVDEFSLEGDIIPAPGAAALLGLGGLMAARRRKA